MRALSTACAVLLSRIKECYGECGDNKRAVANGLQRSGRIITAAAVLVMIVFLGFSGGRNLGIKEMGLSLAIAVLVDATLVPATMPLLGDANWWAPRLLRRLHDRFGMHEASTVEFRGVTTAPMPAAAATGPQSSQALDLASAPASREEIL